MKAFYGVGIQNSKTGETDSNIFEDRAEMTQFVKDCRMKGFKIKSIDFNNGIGAVFIFMIEDKIRVIPTQRRDYHIKVNMDGEVFEEWVFINRRDYEIVNKSEIRW